MEGYLYKKSPNLLIGYQKRYIKNLFKPCLFFPLPLRYFCIRDEGTKLIYYKKKPFIQEKPQGVLEIFEIMDLQRKNTEFFLLFFLKEKINKKAVFHLCGEEIRIKRRIF